ncbi:hypothetical protein ACFLWR_03515 [Chloroflexota bacterium]
MVIHSQTKAGNGEKRTIPIKQTAYHEAGHAVTAYILRLRIIELLIVPDDDYMGMFSHGPGRKITPETDGRQKTRSGLERLAMEALAGNVAEYLLTGKRNLLESV